MRAADTDRERAVSFLSAAYTEGRLTKDEYDERLEQALKARTYSDLDTLVSDLPGAQMFPARLPGNLPVLRARGTNGLAIASLACGLLVITAIPAIILGHMARSQIRRTGEDGAGMALLGLMLGWATVALGTLGLFALTVAFAHTSGVAHAIPHVAHAHTMPRVPSP
jgi:hypothetical protein